MTSQRYFLTRASWTLGKQETKELRHPDNMMRIFGVSQIDDPKGALEDLKKYGRCGELERSRLILVSATAKSRPSPSACSCTL